MSEFPVEKPSGSRFWDLLGLIGFVLVFGLAYLIATNKIPKMYAWFYRHFYVFAIVGILGFLGEKLSVALLGILLPFILVIVTAAMRFNPEKFAVEEWFEIYSLLVIFAAGFGLYLFFKSEKLKQTAGKTEGPISTRVDPRMAAKYREEQAQKEEAKDEVLSKALGPEPKADDGGAAKLRKKKKEEKPPEVINPDETSEDRMQREIRQLKDDFSRKSMKLSTTLLRIKNLSKTLDRDEIFTLALEIVTKGLDAERAQLLLHDEREGKLRVVRAEGMTPKEYKEIAIPLEENSLLTWLVRSAGSGEEIACLGIKECEVDPKTKGLIGVGTLTTLLAAPIKVEGKCFGVINVEKMKNPDYTRDDQNMISSAADIAGLVMKNAKLYAATMDDLVSTKKISEEQLKQNEQLKGSLSRIVSPRVAELIMSNPEGLKLGGSKGEVTVFFSDVRGFTRMSEGMDPTALVEQLNVYFTRMTDILMELDGTLDKYVGDELMALFGAPVARPDDPIRAVLCGLRMMEALRELQEMWKNEGKPNIAIGIGINTGIVTAGYMGSEKQLSYTVIGDNVNLGARVMANAKPMELLVTRSTWERCKEYFDADVLDPIMVKGKSMPIEIFLVKGVKPGVDFSTIISSDLAGSLVAPGAASSAAPSTGGMGRQSSASLAVGEEAMKQNIQIDSKPKVIECANCGNENDTQTKFCTKCGMPIF